MSSRNLYARYLSRFRIYVAGWWRKKAADDISYCTLCPYGSYGNVLGAINECVNCTQEQIENGMCGLGTITPSPNYQVGDNSLHKWDMKPKLVELYPMLLPPMASWYNAFTLFATITVIFCSLLFGVFAPMHRCAKFQKGLREKLKRVDMFPLIPKKLDNSELRIKFYSPFGGIVCFYLFM